MTPPSHLQSAAPIRILHLEDDPVDARLVAELLEEGGIGATFERVDDFGAFKSAVERGDCSLILSDYTIPGMDAFEALRFARATRPGIPYIFVSGTLGEEHAVETLKQGATDYVLKQRLERLVPSVRRALEEVQDRKLREQAQEALRDSEQRLRATFENVALGIVEVDDQHRLVEANERLCRLLGYRKDQLVGRTIHELTAPEDRERTRELNSRMKAGDLDIFDYEKRYLRSDGSPVWVHVTVSPVRDSVGRLHHAIGTVEDITERRRSEDERREAEARLRRTQEIAHLGSWELDIATHRLSWSDEVYRIFGLDPQESGTSYEAFLEAVHPEDRAAVDAAYTASIRDGRDCYEIEHRIVRRRTGEVRFVHEKCEHVRDSSGQIVRSLGMVHDITERQQAEERVRQLNQSLERRNAELEAERSRWQGVVEGIAEEVWVCDARERITLLNLPDATAMGLSEFEAKTLDEVLSEVDITYPDGRPRPPEEAPLLRSLRTGVVVRGEEIMRHRKTGKMRHRQFSCAPTRDPGGAIAGAVAIVRDITEGKRAEQALRDADRRKDEFLAMLSHELRNPLAPIQNSLYILDRVPPGGDQARRARDVIERQIQHMTRLVGDLLDVSRITRGKIQLQQERLDLCQVVARTVEDHRALFAARSLELRVEQPTTAVWANVDATRLAQALGNLLQNAAKFTSAGGRVLVKLEEAVASAVVTVRDTGVGIAPEIMPRIFEPFTQADRSLDRSSGGLGLGLSLVKGLVELHGGEVRASSEGPDRGAEFTIVLPAESAPGRAARERFEIVPGGRRRVLVIEDNVDSAESLKEVLELDEHEVAVAFTGPEGIAKVHELRPDVVLCDIGLPEMDGYSVARALRSDSSLAGVTLVALTGYAGPEDQERSASAGFDYHLAKPPDMSALERILAQTPGRPGR